VEQELTDDRVTKHFFDSLAAQAAGELTRAAAHALPEAELPIREGVIPDAIYGWGDPPPI
jgi:hypothetical protein